MLPRFVFLSICALSVFAGCRGSEPLEPLPGEVRTLGRAVVACAAPSRAEAWILEEELAPWPMVEGDRDPGVRRLVRVDASGRSVLYEPDASARLTDFARHPSGGFTAVGVDAERRPFLARGDETGAILEQRVLDDPELAADLDAWLVEPPDALRVGVLAGDGVRVAADGEDAVVVVSTAEHAVLAYRWSWSGSALERGARTLVTPASPITPFLPIGGSYDVFDAIVNMFLVRVVVDSEGRAWVAHFVNEGRLARVNAVFGSELSLVRSSPAKRPYDVLLARVGEDGERELATVVGTLDLDDELYALAAGGDRVGLVGRVRRYEGLDNTEWDVFVAVVDASGAVVRTEVLDVPGSGIAESVALSEDGTLHVGGSSGWSQNPSGFSVGAAGAPFLLRIGEGDAVIDRTDEVLATEGHAELRALCVGSGGELVYGGLERGPLTHTGDADLSLVRADGFLGVGPL